MKRLWISGWALWLWGLAGALGAQELPTPLAEQIARYGSATEQAVLAETVVVALRAGGDTQELEALLDLALTRSYSAAATGHFIEKVSTLAAADIPARLVRGKILEGMAKRVPADAILAVAETWTQALRTQAEQLAQLQQLGLNATDASTREALINLGTVLARRYAIDNPLSQLAQRMPQPFGSESGVLLALAAQLAETLLLNGASQEQALELGATGLAQGLSVAQMQQLQFQVADQLRQGFSVADVISAQQKLLANPIPATGSLPGTLRDRTPELLPGGRILPSVPGSGLPGGIGGPGIGGPGSRSMPGGSIPGGAIPGGAMPGGLPGVGPGDLPLHNLSGPGLPHL